MKILAEAEKAGKLESPLKAIQQARGNLELLARLDGQLHEREPGQVNVTVQYVDRAIFAPAITPTATVTATAPKCIEAAGVEVGEVKK